MKIKYFHIYKTYVKLENSLTILCAVQDENPFIVFYSSQIIRVSFF